MTTGYDVAVVGGGSAGCVLAARLSQDPARRVVLMEAGPDYLAGQVPQDLADGIHGTSTATHDWGLMGTGVAGVPALSLPRGRVTGGSSAVNATFALRGHPADYDGWGMPGWTFEDVLPAFVRLERDLDFGAGEHHGSAGPVPIRRYRGDERSEVTAAFEDAFAAVGIARIPDHNAPGAVGVSALPVNCVDGRRISTALAYLEPARARPNLSIRADCLVRDVVIRRSRVIGVRVVEGDEIIAADEVFVCAGTYASPGLLLRSGIGRSTDVVALGRSVVADLPGVGANLADHPWVSIDLPCPPPDGDPAVFQLVATTHTGVADSSGAPDIQFMVCGPYPVGDGFGCSLATALLKPRSRGRVTVRSLDPAATPDIDLGYYQDPADLTHLAEGLRLADAATVTSPLQQLTRGARFGPPREVMDGDDAVSAWIRSSTMTYHHPVGTCAMGLDSAAGAVVGPAGSVYGVDGLFVVDASVMPELPSANTNIPTIMVAENIAARRSSLLDRERLSSGTR